MTRKELIEKLQKEMDEEMDAMLAEARKSFPEAFDPGDDEAPMPCPAFDISDYEVDYELLPDDGDNRLDNDFIWQCSHIFLEDGELCNSTTPDGKKREYRPQQREMAMAVAEALAERHNLCIEAPTGIGKSFAYLVPLILGQTEKVHPVVISTETINLQEQLIKRDIPALNSILGKDFKAVLAKGRRNYLCLRRYNLLSDSEKSALLPSPAVAGDLAVLGRWLEAGCTGSRDDMDIRIDPATWDQICCEVHGCTNRKCPFFSKCYYNRARREWAEADIIVANHALLFTDMAMRDEEHPASSLLPCYDALLIDEAHTLEDSAADHLGIHLARYSITSELNKLFNPESNTGLLMRHGQMTELRRLTAAARDETYAFFAAYEDLLTARQESCCRLEPGDMLPDNLSQRLYDLALMLDAMELGDDENDISAEFQMHSSNCSDLAATVRAVSSRQLDNAVYYLESQSRGGVIIHASPLNVAEILQQKLFSRDIPVIMCSATLTVRNSFQYFISRTGFCNGETVMLDSPFSPDQAELILPDTMPDPNTMDYNRALADAIRRYVEITDGKAFVLFTNYQSMRYCAAVLREEFMRRNWQLLVQGENLNRFQMLREFKDDGRAVLFGTDSFWTGVDVPGEALSNVIITKLPFANPRHPLTAAREERLRQAGVSPFSEYSLPEAVLKFRQGVGRLIRNRDDRGIIVILDPRVKTKSYGKIFLDAIPYRTAGAANPAARSKA